MPSSFLLLLWIEGEGIAMEAGRERERETRGEAKAHKPQVVVTIKGEVVTFRRFILPPSPVARSLARSLARPD